MKLEVKEYQFRCIVDMCDTISAMCGGGEDFTDTQRKNVQAFDRIMKKNGYKRKYN